MSHQANIKREIREAWCEAWVRWQVAHEQPATARANVRAGGYTNGMPMTPEDRKLYGILTNVTMVVMICIAIMVGALVALAVTGG